MRRSEFPNMIEESKRIKIFPLVAAASIIFLLYLSVERPYLFGESNLLALMVLVAAGIVASQYETHFWPLMIAVFFWAGSGLPLAGPMELFRWVVLGSSAFLALAYYAMRSHRISFNHLHLLGLFTVVTVFASALVSVNPLMTLLKALSLAALFLYGSIGARILWSTNPEPFVRKLVLMSEVLVYLTAICYLVSFQLWGNPNSLGLIMGCICWPVLLWRWMLPATRYEFRRRSIVLFVCGAFLVASLARASMIAAFLTSMFLLVGARRYRTLLIGVSLFATILLMVYLKAPGRFHSASETLLYKQSERRKLGESREKPWEQSVDTFRERPWLGWGFGVADNSADWRFNYVTIGRLTRERGSSYLTMLEGTGVIGTLPFALLILCLIREIWRVFSWLRRTGKVNHPAVVAAPIILGGIVNAIFEDWMLAVGYYMSVFFWVIALSLRDWMACPVWSDAQPVAEERVGPVLSFGSPALR